MATTYTPTSNSGTDYTSSLAVNDIIQGNYTGSVIPVTVPAGTYKLECWGAQGGYGRALSETAATSGWVTPPLSNFSLYGVLGGNYNILDDNLVAMVGGIGGTVNNNEEGFIELSTNVAGTYRFTIEYGTESRYDLVTVIIDNVTVLSEASGVGSTTYEKSLSRGDYIEIYYSKDVSQSANGDYVSVTIELYEGATSGGWSYGSQTAGGYGGYSVGTLALTSPTTLYLCPGGMGGYDTRSSGTPSRQTNSGGWNGGGYSSTFVYDDAATMAGGGGGASDIRIGNNDLYSRVIVAGGGGGSAGVDDTTNKRGGGTTGSCSGNSSYYGTQIAAGTNGSFGQGADITSSSDYKYGPGGGGGGWYGGGALNNRSDTDTSYRTYNGGGSGYVYTSSTASNYPSGCTLNDSYYLTDASTTTSTRTGNGLIKITVIEIVTEISNGPWTYSIGETLRPNSTLQTSSSWTLTGTNCKKFTVIPQESGYLKIYSNGDLDTYGYIGTTDSTAINSDGAPTNYDKSNDDNGADHGASYSRAFGFYMPVTANTTYYLWVRPYSSSSSASVSISHQVTAGPKLEAKYLKIDSTTWVKI